MLHDPASHFWVNVDPDPGRTSDANLGIGKIIWIRIQILESLSIQFYYCLRSFSAKIGIYGKRYLLHMIIVEKIEGAN